MKEKHLAVYKHAKRLLKLRQTLQGVLPPDMAAHLIGVSLNGNRLVIYSDSPAWNTRLRYMAPALAQCAARQIGALPHLVFLTLPQHRHLKPPAAGRKIPRHQLKKLLGLFNRDSHQV